MYIFSDKTSLFSFITFTQLLMNNQAKPLFVFGTRHGSLFNLTPINTPPISGIQLSVGDFYQHKQTISKLPEGITFNRFLGFSNQIKTYLSPYDFYKKECFAGCDRSDVVKIKCNKGYTEFTAQEYDQVATLIKPDYLVTLTEYPASQKDHKNQSNKSHKRAINKTKSYLQKSVLVKNKIEGTKILGAIHGGKNLSLLSRSLEQILDHEVDGFVICDLCDTETIEEREVIFNTIHNRLSQVENQFIFSLAGMGKIEDIEHGLKFGITIFEINYPFYLAENQIALIKTEDGKYIEKKPERAAELEPLDPNCKCYACERHSESYIAHLIECYEMNAKVLLSIHNIQNYIDYLDKFG